VIFSTPQLGGEEEQVLDLIQNLWNELRANLGNQPRRWTGLLARNLRARAIQGSNSIEGYVVTGEDALAAVDGDKPEEADETSWINVLGYRTAMNYVLRLGLADDVTYDVNLIRSLHFIMMQHNGRANPGTWRPGPIFVKDEATGDIVYEGPPREEVPELMHELCDELASSDGDSASRIIRASMAHLNLVMVHPFSDGNGRMARCLQTLVLARGGVLDPTFSSIEEYLGRNTPAYYDILADVGQGAWRPENTALPWVRFCLSAHFIQAASAKRRLEYVSLVGEEVEARLQRSGLPDRAAVSLTNAVLGYRVRNESYRREADVSLNVASRDLRSLVEAGLLVPFGEKRARYYQAGPWLVELRRMKQHQRKIPNPFDIVRDRASQKGG
jgi:Fic family protein